MPDEEEFTEFEGPDDRFGMDATIKHGEDVLRVVSAEIHDDEDAAKEVLSRYGVDSLVDNPELMDFLSTSLSVNSYLIEVVAVLSATTPEHVIDSMLLDLI